MLRLAIQTAGSQAELARQIGVSPSYLNDVLHERTPPSDRLLEGLGLAREVTIVANREVTIVAKKG